MKSYFIISIVLFVFNCSYAQTDSLILKNGNILIGEFKDLNRGVLGMETDYSDSDFKIEWDGIREIYSSTYFLITTEDGHRYNGKISSEDQNTVSILTDANIKIDVPIREIVELRAIKKDFWSRLYAGVDIGLNLTKSNNFKQLNIRGNVGYLAQRWLIEATYNTLSSRQDDTEPIRRSDGGLVFRRFLPRDWYLPVDATFLSNTEQRLDFRFNGKLGAGKFLIHTNDAYWGFAGGLSYVTEIFSSEDPDKQSLEMYFGTELNLYDIGDLSLLTKAIAYPGITERGRWRIDFNFDTKYDLPLDFYISVGLTINYDNQPVEGATAADYVFTTGFGWSW